MSNLELSGNLNISVKDQQIPVNFYDNIIELHINNFKVLFEFLNIAKSLKQTQFKLFSYKKLFRIKIKSRNIVIKIASGIIKPFI
tara:strand:+ start:1861 stop:2115 length:255 start_codon:yes stop_codon:yes gene_type:complete